jgi:hypothetical protein
LQNQGSDDVTNTSNDRAQTVIFRTFSDQCGKEFLNSCLLRIEKISELEPSIPLKMSASRNAVPEDVLDNVLEEEKEVESEEENEEDDSEDGKEEEEEEEYSVKDEGDIIHIIAGLPGGYRTVRGTPDIKTSEVRSTLGGIPAAKNRIRDVPEKINDTAKSKVITKEKEKEKGKGNISPEVIKGPRSGIVSGNKSPSSGIFSAKSSSSAASSKYSQIPKRWSTSGSRAGSVSLSAGINSPGSLKSRSRNTSPSPEGKKSTNSGMNSPGSDTIVRPDKLKNKKIISNLNSNVQQNSKIDGISTQVTRKKGTDSDSSTYSDVRETLSVFDSDSFSLPESFLTDSYTGDTGSSPVYAWEALENNSDNDNEENENKRKSVNDQRKIEKGKGKEKEKGLEKEKEMGKGSVRSKSNERRKEEEDKDEKRSMQNSENKSVGSSKTKAEGIKERLLGTFFGINKNSKDGNDDKSNNSINNNINSNDNEKNEVINKNNKSIGSNDKGNNKNKIQKTIDKDDVSKDYNTNNNDNNNNNNNNNKKGYESSNASMISSITEKNKYTHENDKSNALIEKEKKIIKGRETHEIDIKTTILEKKGMEGKNNDKAEKNETTEKTKFLFENKNNNYQLNEEKNETINKLENMASYDSFNAFLNDESDEDDDNNNNKNNNNNLKDHEKDSNSYSKYFKISPKDREREIKEESKINREDSIEQRYMSGTKIKHYIAFIY